MRTRPWLAACLLMVSCGDEADVPAGAAEALEEGGANHAPVVESIEITPAAPVVGDTLRVETSVSDPDEDTLELDVEWFVNRESQGPSEPVFDTDTLQRDDEIYAMVRASDGELEVSAQATPVRLGNSAPRVMGLKVLPERPDASQTLVAEASAQDPEGDRHQLQFEWLVNGKPLAGATQPTLEPGNFKRGDEVRVSVRAFDGTLGEALVSAPIVVSNARPQIVSTPATELADDRYVYQIAAEDPDGDRPLRYTLVNGPDGMAVDVLSGLLEWTVPEDVDGTYEFEVAVRDTQGGEARQSFALELHTEAIPAAKSPASSESESDDD